VEALDELFRSGHAGAALEKYAAVTHLTVQVYAADGRLVAGPIGPTPLFELCAHGKPSLPGECLRICLERSEVAVTTDDVHGLAVIGAPLTLAGETLGAVVAGYALTTYPTPYQIRRLATDLRLPFTRVWAVIRSQLPLPEHRLHLHAELLGVVGNTLLSEHDRSRQLEESLGRVEAADRAKDEFLATLSHELRTPLTTVLGWARLLRSRDLDAATVARGLETIERSARTQARLINDLLDVSRIITGKLALEVQAVELLPIIEEVLDDVRPIAEAKGLRLASRLDPSVGAVSGDPGRLRQIVENLLSNAVKFTPAGGGVEVHLDAVGGAARIVVSDTGKGIAPGFLPHIFDRFRQADASITKAEGGLGLGLSIVRHLVDLHAGRVSADSAGEGKGATFTVILPLRSQAPEPRAEGAAELHATRPALHGIRVLVVDDDADTRDFLGVALRECGASVTVAASAEEALRALDCSIPDALVCDVGMPGTDGYRLMRRVRGRRPEAGGTVPAVAVTGYVGNEDRESALAAGYQMHLAKPVEPDDLARVVARLVGRAA
jgi:signal transduction histidine kinase/CheY-like chemotaxis protein